MTKPSEPGFYFYYEYGLIYIVKVIHRQCMAPYEIAIFHGNRRQSVDSMTQDGQWGPKIEEWRPNEDNQGE
jgi:hypothetical protein